MDIGARLSCNIVIVPGYQTRRGYRIYAPYLYTDVHSLDTFRIAVLTFDITTNNYIVREQKHTLITILVVSLVGGGGGGGDGGGGCRAGKFRVDQTKVIKVRLLKSLKAPTEFTRRAQACKRTHTHTHTRGRGRHILTTQVIGVPPCTSIVPLYRSARFLSNISFSTIYCVIHPRSDRIKPLASASIQLDDLEILKLLST